MTLQITVEDYFTGPARTRRDVKFASDMTEAIRDNAKVTVERVNELLAYMAADGVPLIADNSTGSLSHSGWRPPAINQATKGAAVFSKHLTGQACDLYDPNNYLDEWCMNNLDELGRIGLWLESPNSTPGWCHVQTVPPRSGNRVFIP